MKEMSKDALCCDDCLFMIARRSTTAARLWLDLCDIQLSCIGIFGVKKLNNIALRVLEQMGFVVSTEQPKMILIKVKGMMEDGEQTYFCGGNCGKD